MPPTAPPAREDRTPVVVAARRTPVGTAGHSLREVDVVGLAAPVLAALLDDLRTAGVDRPVDDVVLGNVMGPGGNPARVAALAAGLGEQVPGVSVDRQCGSGQEAVHQGAAAVLAGADLVLAGGVESASTAPTRTWPSGEAYARAPFAPADLGDPDMGPAADEVAARCGVVAGAPGRPGAALAPARRRRCRRAARSTPRPCRSAAPPATSVRVRG